MKAKDFLIAALKALAISAVIAPFVWLIILFFKDFQAINNDLQTTANQEKIMKQSISATRS